MEVVPVHRPDRFPSATLLGGAVGADVELSGIVISCVEQPIAKTASRHRPASKRSARLRLAGAKDFILFRLEVPAAVAANLRCHLGRRRTYTRSCARVTAALVRSIRGGSGNQGVRHRWNIAGRLLGYPLLRRQVYLLP